MYARINGADLFFDVEGSGYVPSGEEMVSKPACLVLHGGPGSDHSYFKPWLTPLSETRRPVVGAADLGSGLAGPGGARERVPAVERPIGSADGRLLSRHVRGRPGGQRLHAREADRVHTR